MLLKISLIIRYSILGLLITFLTACTGINGLENRLSPNPGLQKNSQQTELSQAKLPENFPTIIPQDPNSTLKEVADNSTEDKGLTRWSSQEDINTIVGFYQEQFKSNSWEITQPFDANNNILAAQKDGLDVKLSFLAANDGTVDYSLDYQRLNSTITATPSDSQPPSNPSNTGEIVNFENIPDALSSYVQEVANLGVLSLDKTGNKTLNATAIINRRTYARWLLEAYNKFYENTPAKQLRLGVKTSQPAFSDVGVNDPDFPIIQGLAEAGIIPSRLTSDSSASLFRPNAPLTREDLITWKVPLDMGKGLPKASLDNIKETWGFQDTAKIDVKAIQALYGDFQNSEQSNVRRVFGYTTLFQPKKPVTLGEAAATLWYFGYQGDGLSAKDILQK
ncbi:S-layer homology domain-containing protein [Crocosphaera sp. UHCC 0190]|uniref:S-layer homology domain-containing protein n=1 Tax=Crocosphaera sp. UHCC 0190 TaxID=3110246 RepID=UPI002B20BE2F|nr:S-layer homology domain-containing protein [Crocosphaera sp. UHCC 0190]MEA5510211.1 S-layer homology domain-containing protein [Crocosphaera sp. UHCC 0190]